MSDDCTHARTQLQAAETDTAGALRQVKAAEAAVESAERALAAARDHVNVMSHEAGVAERAIDPARQRLKDQEWMPDYPGKDRDVAQKQELIDQAVAASQAAGRRRDDAVNKSNAALDTLKDRQSELAKAHSEHASAQTRERNWEIRVREVCG